MRLGKSWRNFPSEDMEHISAYKSKVLSNGMRNSMAKYPHQDEGMRLDRVDK